jgi:hypothetical protein
MLFRASNSVFAMSEQLSEQNPMIVTSVFQAYARAFQEASSDIRDANFVLEDCRSKLNALMNDSSMKTRAQMEKWQKDVEKCESIIERIETQRRELLDASVPHNVPTDFVL